MTVGREVRERDKLRAWVDAGRPFKPWDKRPRLTEADAMLREAWVELDSCRPRGGMGALARIPWTAIESYAEARGYVDRERFHALIRRMDDAFLEQAHERMDKQERDTNANGDKRGH